MQTTELERREALSDKCLELANIALTQQDEATFKQLFRQSVRLHLANWSALRLEYGSAFIDYMQNNPEVTEFINSILHWGGRELLVNAGFEDFVLFLED